MPDDEPLDDARAVGMAAAAATAKVVEMAARAATDRQERGLTQVPRDPAAERRLNELPAAERWAASQNPDRLHPYYAERDGALSGTPVDTDRLRGAKSSLVTDSRRPAGPQASDAPNRRNARNQHQQDQEHRTGLRQRRSPHRRRQRAESSRSG